MANSVRKEKQKKIIELERIYIYPNEFHPNEVMFNTFKDITKIDPKDISETEIIDTISNGRIVYSK